MASATPEIAQAAQVRLLADPEFQRLKQRAQSLASSVNGSNPNSFNDYQAAQSAADQYLQSHGLLPNDWEYDYKQDQLVKKSWGDRNPLLRAGLLMGGAVAAPAAYGTIGVGGGASSAGGAGTAGTAAGGAAGGGSYIKDAIKGSSDEALGGGGTDWVDLIKKIALGVAPLAAGGVSHALAGGGGDTQANIPPELTELLKTAMQRMSAQQPLVDAVNKQALGGLPTYAKGGV